MSATTGTSVIFKFPGRVLRCLLQVAQPLQPTTATAQLPAREEFRNLLRTKSLSFWVLGVAAAFRLLFLIALKPIWVPDSLSYTSACALWATHFFTDGARTPLYPLLLGLAQSIAGVPAISSLDPVAAYVLIAIQCVLGVASSCLILDVLLRLEVRRHVAFIAALGFSVLYQSCIYEQIVLTETLSLFSLVLLLWLVVRMGSKLNEGRRITGTAIVAGVTAGTSILVRPENLVVVLCVFLFLLIAAVKDRFQSRQRTLVFSIARAALLFGISCAPLVLGWMTFNYVGVGQFRITTSTGWQMSQAVYNLWDRVPPEDRVLGEALSRSYARRGELGRGDRRDHFWLVFDELTTRSRELPLDNSRANLVRHGIAGWLYGLVPESSRYYTHKYSAGAVMRPTTSIEVPNSVGDYVGTVSWKLIRMYPRVWLRNAATGFLQTFSFAPAVPWRGDGVAVTGGSVERFPALATMLVRTGRIESPVLTILYCATIGFVLLLPFTLAINDWTRFLRCWTVSAFATGTLGTMLAYCLLAGYDPRYAIPHTGTLVVCGAVAIDRVMNRFRKPAG